MVALAIMLFISMYFVGKRIEEPKTEAEQVKEQHTFSAEKEPVIKEQQSAQHHEAGEEIESHENLTTEEVESNIRPLSEAPKEELSYSLSDLYDQQLIEQTKETAFKFVQAIFTFDGDQPYQHIEKAKPYMSEELQQRTSQFVGRATNEMYRAVLTDTKITEAYDQQDGYFVWLVTVDGDFYSNENKLTSSVTYEYIVVLHELNNQIEVINYELRKLAS